MLLYKVETEYLYTVLNGLISLRFLLTHNRKLKSVPKSAPYKFLQHSEVIIHWRYLQCNYFSGRRFEIRRTFGITCYGNLCSDIIPISKWSS